MSEITSTVWGIPPWSDELLKVSGDVDRGRASTAAYAGQLSRDFRAYYDVLEEAEIDFRSGGWGGGTKDYFRDTALSSEGFQDGVQDAPVTRWFDTNTFYRQPTINGPISLVHPLAHGYYTQQFGLGDHADTYQPTLLSPYAFSKLAAKGTDLSEKEAERYVGDLYEELLDDACKQGVQRVLLHEPFAPYHQIDESERAKLGALIGNLAANNPKIGVAVYFSFGDASKLLNDFSDEDNFVAIGADLRSTPFKGLPSYVPRQFIAGLVDGANTLENDDEVIIRDIELLHNLVDARGVSLTHTIDLEHVPRSYALRKIRQIGRIARALKEGNI